MSSVTEEIRVLEPHEAIRKRPGMYVGDTAGESGMHVMLWQVLDLVIERGHRDVRIEVKGHRATIEHLGLDVALEELEHALTRLHGMFRYPCDFITATCALSRELEATVWRDGHAFVQRYHRGVARGPFAAVARSERTGFRLSFVPDPAIFTRRRWNVKVIDARCRDLATLLPGLRIACNGTRHLYRDGLAARVRSRFDPCVARVKIDGVRVDVAIAWSDQPGIYSFVNFHPSEHGGPHVEGMLGGIEAVLAPRLRGGPLRKRLARGLAAAIHLVIDNPRYDQTRRPIVNVEVAPIVRALVERELARHFDATPALLDTILIDAC